MANIYLEPLLHLIQEQISLPNVSHNLIQHLPLSLSRHPIVGGAKVTKGNL